MYCPEHVDGSQRKSDKTWGQQKQAKQEVLNPLLQISRDLTKFWPPTAFDTSALGITSRRRVEGFPRAGSTDLRSWHIKIQQILDKELNLNEQPDEGYVCAFEVPGNEGLVKIGYTTGTVSKRHAEWRFACNRQVKELCAVKVPHAYRVERLCHADLANSQVQIFCPGCWASHLEWFEVTSSEAKEVAEKWCRWMNTRKPYRKKEMRLGPKWLFKTEERQKCRDMRRYLADITSKCF
ncbi:T5orf172 domain-containing protein [Xylariales sp. PMI_506]|nr:T5orf172 domain-containing protein [Xylariales sp. PMI_506]